MRLKLFCGNKYKIYLLSFFILVNFCDNIFAQEDIPSRQYFLYPTYHSVYEYKHAVGLFAGRLPEDMVEESSDWFRAPLFSYAASFGLHENIILNGSLTSNVITYQIALGGKYIYQHSKISVSGGAELAYFFGALRHFGFDSKINGWIVYPNVTIGYRFSKFAISLTAEVPILLSVTEYADDIKITTEIDDINGFSLGIFIEQPLWKDQFVILGVKVNYIKFYYPVWAAFPTFNRNFWIPEVYIGFLL